MSTAFRRPIRDIANIRCILNDDAALTQVCRVALHTSNCCDSQPATPCYMFGQSIVESYGIADGAIIEKLTEMYRRHFPAVGSPKQIKKPFETRCCDFLRDTLIIIEEFLSRPKKVPSWQSRDAPAAQEDALPLKEPEDTEIASTPEPKEADIVPKVSVVQQPTLPPARWSSFLSPQRGSRRILPCLPGTQTLSPASRKLA